MCPHVRPTVSGSFISLISLQPRSMNDKSSEVWTGRSIYYGNKVRKGFVSTSEQTRHLHAAERLRVLEEDNRRLTENLHACLEDIHNMRSSSAAPRPVSHPIHGAPPNPHFFQGRSREPSLTGPFFQMGIVRQVVTVADQADSGNYPRKSAVVTSTCGARFQRK